MVDPLSLISILIEPYFNETKLGSATGFIIEKNSQQYLVTNWHVVTGNNFGNMAGRDIIIQSS